MDPCYAKILKVWANSPSLSWIRHAKDGARVREQGLKIKGVQWLASGVAAAAKSFCRSKEATLPYTQLIVKQKAK